MRIDHIVDPDAERLFVEQVAGRYRAEGFAVSRPEVAAVALDGLEHVVPDLVATRDGEVVLVEIVRELGPDAASRIREMGHWAEQRPGHRLDVVVGDGRDVEWRRWGEAALDPKGIAERLDAADRLRGDGQAPAAMLLTWSAFEAAARIAVSRLGRLAGDLISPSALVSRLVFEGHLDDDEGELLRRAELRRNAVAHGFHDERDDGPLFVAVAALTRRLLAETPADRAA